MKVLFFLFFLIISISYSQIQGISEAEWFTGFDPGEGNGEPIKIDSGLSTISILQNSFPKGVGTLPLPRLKLGSQPIFIRVKSTGFKRKDGSWVSGKWSLPMMVNFPTNQVLKRAHARILRNGNLIELNNVAAPSDGKLDNVVESIRAIIPCEDLKAGDTLILWIQGFCDLWGGSPKKDGRPLLIPITDKTLKLCSPSDLKISKIETSPTPKVHLTWKFLCTGATGFKIERRDSHNPNWYEIYKTAKGDTSFIDDQVMIMERYSWRVSAINDNAKCNLNSDPSNEVTTRIVSVQENYINVSTTSLKINPNPITDISTISFFINYATKVNLSISNLIGERILFVLHEEQLEPGEHKIDFDSGALLDGIYFCTLQTNKETVTVMLILNR